MQSEVGREGGGKERREGGKEGGGKEGRWEVGREEEGGKGEGRNERGDCDIIQIVIAQTTQLQCQW